MDAGGRLGQRGASSQTRSHTAENEIAVIGAGPYGLSAAAHLKASGVRVRVFGVPMEFWAKNMPEGMLLRSPREASDISGPSESFELRAYEAVAGRRAVAPIPLRTFVEYGQWFAHQLGSDLDRRMVSTVDRGQAGFVLSLADGEKVPFGRVVVAAGVGSFKRIPAALKHLDPARASHCYDGRDMRGFSGMRVAVIGGGQSALESAALLHEAGAEVEVIAKEPKLRWVGMHPRLHHLGPISALLYSKYDVGPAGISRLVAMPRLVNRIPLGLRDRIRIRAVRPAGAKWLPERLANVRVTTGRQVTSAWSVREDIGMKLDDGSERWADHVLMGTGYSVDISRYKFLGCELLAAIRLHGGFPVLKAGLCSSIPRLHFIGAAAGRSFGPLLNFVAGTEFASRELVSRVLGEQRPGQSSEPKRHMWG